jgi:hypothetical protein
MLRTLLEMDGSERISGEQSILQPIVPQKTEKGGYGMNLWQEEAR